MRQSPIPILPLWQFCFNKYVAWQVYQLHLDTLHCMHPVSHCLTAHASTNSGAGAQ